jgi:hypothetical protein
MLVIHGFVAPTTARKSNMTVAGRPRPHWEMAGRQGSFRARAMPDAVLSQGRAEGRGEREGGGRGIHCNSALQRCSSVGERLTPRASPSSGPFARMMFPGIVCRQDSPVREHCTVHLHRTARARLVPGLRLRRRPRLRLRLSQTRAAINSGAFWVPDSRPAVTVGRES